MKKRNIAIVALLLVGLGALALVEGYIKPEMRRKEELYQAEQGEPLTHDLGRLRPFKSRYMGDASNLSNLNANLPLSEIPRTFELFPETLTAEIDYRSPATAVRTDLFHRALIYNATANFAFIDNLEVLILNFEGVTYTISRRAVERWYELAPARLRGEEAWAERVQRPLSDREYVLSFIEENFTVQ